MHEVLVNRLGGLSLPMKSVVRLIDRPDMTLDVYRGRKTTMQCNWTKLKSSHLPWSLSACTRIYRLANREVVRRRDLGFKSDPKKTDLAIPGLVV